MITITYHVTVAWWFKLLYLPGVAFMAYWTGLIPDEKRWLYYLNKAVSIKNSDGREMRYGDIEVAQ